MNKAEATEQLSHPEGYNHKYIVFNREEYENDTQAQEIPDAVVIRRQDAFAPPALDAYANGIQAVIETFKAIQDQMFDGEPPLTEFTDQLNSLQEKADDFHQQAELAWGTQRKLPD